ncbi:MAG: transglycosylase family protein [Micrococcales bacterium]|nr:transglycosylase family protein [Micrococcales bacterium]
MHYSPKHAAPKNSPVARRAAGVALAGGATIAGGMAVAQPASAAGTVWDRVAACESGGNWSINTGNGYYGGLQFSYSTWRAYGGGAYASTANRATKAQQITIAKKVLSAQGPGAWPVCSVRAGLTRASGLAVSTGSTATSRTTTTASRSTVRVTRLVVDGARGPKTTAAIEKWVGGSVNGSLSRSDIQKLQRKVGTPADGVVGSKTMRALQTKIGARKNGTRSLNDRATVRTLQSYLNRNVIR